MNGVLYFFLLVVLFLYCPLHCQVEALTEALPIAEWNKAGGIQLEGDLEVIRVLPGVDLNKVIKESAVDKGVIISLSAGKYFVDQPIHMRSKVYLKGTHRDSVWIISRFKRPFHPSPFHTDCTIEFQNLEWAGISNVTLSYGAVDFLPSTLNGFHEVWDRKVFQNNPQGDSLLYVGHIGVKRSKQVIIDNCNILNAGTDPIVLAEAQQVSIINSHIKGAYNKGGKGNGYFNIDANSSYVLLKNSRVEKIRHLAIQNGAHHNVIVGNDLEVDVNFHNGDAGYNLVEGNTIRIPEWHGWHCFSAGAKSKHAPPGPHNYLFNNFTHYKQQIPQIRPTVTEYGDSIIYTSTQIIDTIIVGEQLMIRYELGDVDYRRLRKTNRLFVMNDEWNDQKRVLFVRALKVNKLYAK